MENETTTVVVENPPFPDAKEDFTLGVQRISDVITGLFDFFMLFVRAISELFK